MDPSAHRTSLDALSLQALGIQDLQESLARNAKGFDAGGEVRDRSGHSGSGDQNYESESAHSTEGRPSGEGLVDGGFYKQGLGGTALNSSEGQVKNNV